MATAKKAKTESTVVPKPKEAGVYIDPRTDFGFKRLFGDKEVMIGFLNSVLDVEIRKLEYGNTVKTGLSKDEKEIIFDLYCTTVKGVQILVEMQIMPHEFYRERIVYYASRLIQEQGVHGWDYELKMVYSINIIDFKLDKNKKTDKYLSNIQLLDIDTHYLFYDKLKIIILELPRFKKDEKDLVTKVEQWMYAIRDLAKLDKQPKSLKDKHFTKLFELAQIAKMTSREQNIYYKSLQDMSLVKIQFGKMEKTIADLQKENAELRRILELRGTTAPKTARNTKVTRIAREIV